MKIKYLFIIYFVLLTSTTFGSWQGPNEIISASFGSAPSQIGIKYSESFDRIAKLFLVDGSGNIIIGDEVNRRVAIFKTDGSLSTFSTPIDLVKTRILYWPSNLAVLNDSEIFIATDGHFQLFNYQGEKLSEYIIPLDYLVEKVNQDGSVYFKSKTNYVLFSFTGQLIRSYTTRPLELGDIKEMWLPGGKYKYTLNYPDGTYSIVSEAIFEEGLARDNKTNIYGIGTITNPQDIYVSAEWEGNTVAETPQPHYIVSRFSPCGKLQGRMDLPADKSKFKKTASGVIRDESLLRQYGKPVVAPNGDVYAWQRTSTAYSILKWTWVDDPNAPTGPDAPTNLSVMPSTNGLYLTWAASPQDPGCVTGYEINQATTSGGPYTTVATVNAGMLKYNDTSASAGTTYYYKVRAKAGTDYSPYTAEVSGKR